jgi:hypothetical protein
MEQHGMDHRVKGDIRLNKRRNISLVDKFYHIGSPNTKFGLLNFKREKGIQKYLYSFLHIGPDKFKLARNRFL